MCHPHPIDPESKVTAQLAAAESARDKATTVNAYARLTGFIDGLRYCLDAYSHSAPPRYIGGVPSEDSAISPSPDGQAVLGLQESPAP